MIAINIEKQMRTYQGQNTLKVNTKLNSGSITKVTGVSGCGKTTLLKIIAGLTVPEKGKIEVNGQLWQDTTTGFMLPPQQRRVGFVFQDHALFPNMTVMEHLRYAGKDERWINRLLLFSKLENLRQVKPLYLSGGQQQRLGIIRALATKPIVLLMDEPFSALDMDMRVTLMTELKILIDELACTTLIVSHEPPDPVKGELICNGLLCI